MASIRKNFAYNLILTLSGYVFPLLTYPYVSRVLGVSNLGTCNFITSIINYYILFANLGITSYGIREIARYTENIEKRNKIFSNLFAINAITTFISLAILIVTTLIMPTLKVYKPFLAIGALQLIFNLFLTNWFFQGISDFKYITYRSLAIKILYVFSVFLFIHDKGDTLLYFLLTVLVVVLNAIVNWIYGRKYRTLSFHNLHIGSFIKPTVTFGFYLIVTSMYTSFNTIFLGFVTNTTEVGYFTTATKLYTIIMSVFSAFTAVMVPKVAKLLKEKNFNHLQHIANDTFILIVVFSIPIIMFCELNADSIILIISGRGYEGAITPFRIVILLLIIIGFEQIIIQQFLMASSSNKAVIFVGIVGVVIGLSVNIIFTPLFGSTGSALAWGLSELGVLCSGIVFAHRVLHLQFEVKMLTKKILQSLIYAVPFLLLLLPITQWTIFAVSALYTILIFLWINIYHDKNKYVVDTWNRVFGRIHHISLK